MEPLFDALGPLTEIVVPEGTVVFLTIVLSFIFNQVLALLKLKPTEATKKAVAYIFAVGVTAYFGYEQGAFLLPDFSEPIQASLSLLALATLNFKMAQPIYDRLWKALLAA